MKDAIDPKRVATILHFSKKVDEEKNHLRIAKTIPFDTPIFLTIEVEIRGYSCYDKRYLISVKEMDQHHIICEVLAYQDEDFIINDFNTHMKILIATIVKWRVWVPEDAPRTINWKYLSDEYKAMAFGK